MTNLEVKKLAERIFNGQCKALDLDGVNLYFTVDLKGRIAQAYTKKKFVEVDLWKMITNPAKIPEVMAHELCHIKHPGKHHGLDWKEEMQKLGFLGRVTDHWDVSEKAAMKVWNV